MTTHYTQNEHKHGKGAHSHFYEQHPRFNDMAYCVTCGFAAPKAAFTRTTLVTPTQFGDSLSEIRERVTL